MKKFILVAIFFIGLYSEANAQLFSIPKWDYYYDLKAHEKGQIHFSYGYGQPRLDQKLFQYHKKETDFRVVGIGPFYFKTEWGLSRKLSVALSCAYTNYQSDWTRRLPDLLIPTDSFNYKFGTVLHDGYANIRFNYHLLVTKDLDVYLGGGAGYNYFKHNDFTEYSPLDTIFNAQFKKPFPVSFEMSFGARYYFLTRTAIYAEAGYDGKAVAQAGFVFKFRYRKKE